MANDVAKQWNANIIINDAKPMNMGENFNPIGNLIKPAASGNIHLMFVKQHMPTKAP